MTSMVTIHLLAASFATTVFGVGAMGQGSAVISPMSAVVGTSQQIISFQINNQLEGELRLKLTKQCEIDGVSFSDADCDTYFKMQGPEIGIDGVLRIERGRSVSMELFLKRTVEKYALFKPLFAPESREASEQEIPFEFRYQPGYLFLLQPDMSPLRIAEFKTRQDENSRFAVWEFDLTSLRAPSVMTISAKLIDKSTKRLVRFLRIANEKMLDPARKKLALEGAFAPAAEQTSVCYELIVQRFGNKQMEKYTDCP